MGKKRQPIYKLVAADSRSPRDGRFIEAIGLYNPKTEPTTVEIDEERALYWLGVGAQPTETVKNLLSAEGILYKRSLKLKGMSDDEIVKEMEEWQSKREAKVMQSKAKAEKAAAEKEKAKAKAAEEKAKEEAEAEAKKNAEAAEKTEENSDAAEETKDEEKSE
jgi:small subunit ribosomal protein S16